MHFYASIHYLLDIKRRNTGGTVEVDPVQSLLADEGATSCFHSLLFIILFFLIFKRSRSHSKERSRKHRSRSRDRRRSRSRERRRYRSRSRDRYRRSRSRDRRDRRGSRRSPPNRDRRSPSPFKQGFGNKDRFSPPQQQQMFGAGPVKRNRSPDPEPPSEDKDRRTVMCMQLAAKVGRDELIDFFKSAGKVSTATCSLVFHFNQYIVFLRLRKLML